MEVLLADAAVAEVRLRFEDMVNAMQGMWNEGVAGNCGRAREGEEERERRKERGKEGRREERRKGRKEEKGKRWKSVGE